MGFPWLLPLLSSTRTCLHCRLAFTQHTLHLHSRPTPNQHAPMSPLLTSTHLAHTYGFIVHQHPPSTHMSPSLASTHPCLHCWPAPTQQAPMSPSLASKHPPTPTKATAVLLPAVGCPRVVPRMRPEMCYFTKVSWPPGLPYCNLYYCTKQEPQDDKKKNNNNLPLGPPDAARGPIPLHSDKSHHGAGLQTKTLYPSTKNGILRIFFLSTNYPFLFINPFTRIILLIVFFWVFRPPFSRAFFSFSTDRFFF